jgi:hypothetical protein
MVCNKATINRHKFTISSFGIQNGVDSIFTTKHTKWEKMYLELLRALRVLRGEYILPLQFSGLKNQ